MKVIARFYWNCERMGSIDGLFMCEKDELEKAYGKEVYLGEVLGKHSDIYGPLNPKDVTILTEDQDFIHKVEEIIGLTLSGFNPLEYLKDEEDDENDDGESSDE